MNLIEKRGKLKSKNVLEKKMTQMNYGIATWNNPNSMTLTTSQQFGCHQVFTKLHWQQLINRLNILAFATSNHVIYFVAYVTKFKTLCISVFDSLTGCPCLMSNRHWNILDFMNFILALFQSWLIYYLFHCIMIIFHIAFALLNENNVVANSMINIESLHLYCIHIISTPYLYCMFNFECRWCNIATMWLQAL